MTKRKLKKYVIPAIYILAITTIVISVLIIGRTVKNFKEEENKNDYVINPVIEETVPVQGEEVVENNKVIRPYSNESVAVKKEFYEKDAKEAAQQNALIYYEGTYMQNSGILYGSEVDFEVLATMAGKISNIKEDELLGTIIEIQHNSKLTTVYQSLKEAKVTVGQDVKQGDIIGVSGTNKIDPSLKSALLFEVYHNGALINPNNYYDKEIKAFSE